MELQTTRFGHIEILDVSEESVLEFPHGLPGFESHKSFALLEELKYLPFRWLQSLVDPTVVFLVIDPRSILGQYEIHVDDLDVECLELLDGEDPGALCIVVMPEDPRSATINLKAPITINQSRRRAKQVILTSERYPLRYPLFQPDQTQHPAAN
jgi:flagellar assembly factor FliW